MPQFECVCIGRACVDFLNLLERYPTEDSKVPSNEFLLEGGGQASTAACFLGNMGIKTLFLGQIGDDILGDILVNKMEEYGVCNDFINVERDSYTPTANIVVSSQTESRTIIYEESNFPDWTFNSQQREIIENSEVVLLDPQEIEKGERIASFCDGKEPRIVCDIERATPEQVKIANFADFYVTSSSFLQELDENTSLKEKLKMSLQRTDSALITTFGKRGSIGFQAGEFFKVPALEVEVRDTTGAGDIYHGGICYGIIQGWSLKRTMRFASVAASLSCEKFGGRKGIPSREEVLRHFTSGTPDV